MMITIRKIKCKCGYEYLCRKADLQNVYTKRKPKGAYHIIKVAYCPECGEKYVVSDEGAKK